VGQTRYLVHYIYRTGKSARYAQEQLSSFTSSKFRVSVGDEYGFTLQSAFTRQNLVWLLEML
jgi:hypothetical protein